MVGALMYLTASRPDIVHATCYCARYQVKPTEKHLTTVKRIFRYLKDTINMGLWYPKETGFELTAFSDSDHAGCLDSRKSTSVVIVISSGDKFSQLFLPKSKTAIQCLPQKQIMASTLIKYLCIVTQSSIAIACNPFQAIPYKHIDVNITSNKGTVEKVLLN
ncbi:hypothetical protein Tco_0663596 [Tanacetum coccineum]